MSTSQSSSKTMSNNKQSKPKPKPKPRQPRNKYEYDAQPSLNLGKVSNSLVTKVARPSRRFGPNGKQSIIVTQREFISKIKGNTSFAVVGQVQFNPGQVNAFPWLSQQAAQWERYSVKSTRYHYCPLGSAYDPPTQRGRVIMMFDYDASDPAPNSTAVMYNSFPNNSAMPYQEMYLDLQPKLLNSQDSKYVRVGNLPGGADIKTYDGGTLWVGAEGTTDGSSFIGELFVEYTIELIVPVLASALSQPPTNNSVSYFRSNTGGELGAASTNFFIPTLPITVFNALGINNASGSFTLPAGNYLLSITMFTTEIGGNLTGISLGCYVNGSTAGFNGFSSTGILYDINSTSGVVPAQVYSYQKSLAGTWPIQAAANTIISLRGLNNYTAAVPVNYFSLTITVV